MINRAKTKRGQVEMYLASRKTPATVQQASKRISGVDYDTTIARHLRRLCEADVAVNTAPRGGPAKYALRSSVTASSN